MSKKKRGAHPPRRLGPYTNIGLRLELTALQLARLAELHPDVFDIVMNGVKVTDDQLNSLIKLICGLATDQALQDFVDAGLVEKFTGPDGKPAVRATGLGHQLDEHQAMTLLHRRRAMIDEEGRVSRRKRSS